MTGKRRGIPALAFGCILLTGGILVLVFVPSWGHWIGTYPERAVSLPPGLGPLIHQVGDHYIRAAGYFVGSLMTIVGTGVTFVGSALLRKGQI